MPLTLAEAAKLTPNAFQRNIIESVITSCELWPFMPIQIIPGPALQYARENSLAGAAATAVGGTITESASTFTQVTSQLETIVGDVDVDNRLQSTYSNIIDQTRAQVVLKAKAVRRTLESQLATGNGTTPNLAGWNTLATGSQLISSVGANGDSVSFALLDTMIDSALLMKAGQVAFMCNAALKGRILALLRTVNYNGPWMQIPSAFRPGPADNQSMPAPLMVPTYRGIPIIQVDHIPNTESKGTLTNGTSLYLASLDADAGLCVGVGVAGRNDDTLAGEGIFGVERVGLVVNADATRYRVKIYAQQMLKSDKALVRARELIGL